MPRRVQYDNSFGLDLSQVVAWKRISTSSEPEAVTEEGDALDVYFSGSTMRIEKNTLGENNFNNLLKSLVEEFSPRPVNTTDERYTTIVNG